MSCYRQKIMRELGKIEREENVRILYACESGSRAWGFPSQDSDYDVRFLYIRPHEWYLSIFDKRDVIERPIDGLLDINGWDLRKALQLFRKSNPPLMEWLCSPIAYMESYSAAGRLRRLSELAYSPKSCLHHYLHMAKGNERDYLRGEFVRIKKYLYVLRPLFACSWIDTYGSLPPVEFDRSVEALIPDGSELKRAIGELLERKRAGEELDAGPRIEPIHAYIDEKLAHFDSVTASIAHGQKVSDDELDRLFRSTLQEVWSG